MQRISRLLVCLLLLQLGSGRAGEAAGTAEAWGCAKLENRAPCPAVQCQEETNIIPLINAWSMLLLHVASQCKRCPHGRAALGNKNNSWDRILNTQPPAQALCKNSAAERTPFPPPLAWLISLLPLHLPAAANAATAFMHPLHSSAESVAFSEAGNMALLDRYGNLYEALMESGCGNARGSSTIGDDVASSGSDGRNLQRNDAISFVLNPEPMARLGAGRPLGYHYDGEQNLIVCDSLKVPCSQPGGRGGNQSASGAALLPSGLQYPCSVPSVVLLTFHGDG